MKKKQILIALVLVCILSISATTGLAQTSVAFSDEDTIDWGDSLSRSQEEYLAATGVSGIARFSTNDSDQIRGVCQAFLAINRASVRSEYYDSTSLVSTEALHSTTIQYRLSEYTALETIHEQAEILWDDLEYSNFNCTITGNTATASIVETYRYYALDGFDTESYRMREYFFAFGKENGNWLISDVTTNDPWETAEDFDYAPIVVVQEQLAIATDIVPISEAEAYEQRFSVVDEAAAASTSLYRWTYNVNNAVSYAQKYYNATTTDDLHPLFSYLSADCQNFASQCVWAGLVSNYATATSLDVAPAISSTYLGTTNAPNIWSPRSTSTYYSYYKWNYSWTSTRGFIKMMLTCDPNREGPWGGVHFGTLAHAAAGDVLAWDEDGAPSESTTDHAMFVTQANGTMGQRTMSNLFIAAHNSETNSAYQALSSYAKGFSDTDFADSIIISAYYAAPQG